MKITQEDHQYLVADDAGQMLLAVETNDVTFPNSTGYGSTTVCELVSLTANTTDKSLLLEAMRLVIEEVKIDYDDTFYVPSELFEEEKAILRPLFEKGYLTQKALLDPENEDYRHDLSDKVTLKNLKSASVKPKTGHSSSGSLPHTAKIEKRKPRSYKNETMPQVLRHIATQLYSYAKELKLHPIEVQLMFFNSSLFIATNNALVTKQLFSHIDGLDALKNILVKSYATRLKSESSLLARFAAKIDARIYTEYKFADQRANLLKTILTDAAKFKTAEIDMQAIDIEEINNNTAIYFITDTGKSERHAELELLALFRALHDTREGIIYGKKRPCFTCHSELEHYNTDADFNFVEYNPRKGFFFSEELNKQKKDVLESTVASLAYTGTIYETEYLPGYCTLSDSELESGDEEEEVIVRDLKKKAVIS